MCTAAAPACAAAMQSAAIASGVKGTLSLLLTVSPDPVTAQVMKASRDVVRELIDEYFTKFDGICWIVIALLNGAVGFSTLEAQPVMLVQAYPGTQKTEQNESRILHRNADA